MKPRLPQAAVLHRETYAADHQVHVGAYDSALGAFQAGQGLKPVGWTPSVLTKIASAAALNGRHRLGEALSRLGFPLR